MRLLLELFLAFLEVGLCAFGGGYAALPFIEQQAVDIHHWLSASEFSNLTAISQMTPGPISINAATFTGMKTAGIPGACIATIGFILPPCIIVGLLVWFYKKHRDNPVMACVLQSLRPGVAALIALAGISLAGSTVFPAGTLSLETGKWHLVILGVFAWYLLKKKKMDPVLVLCISGALNMAVCWGISCL